MTQSLYMNIHSTGTSIKIISPYHIQQPFSGKSNIPISNQYLQQLILSLTGHHCTQAFDGLSAVELLENRKFDLIVLDIMLPRLDGYQVFERAFGTPTIFLTAKSELTDKLKGLSSSTINISANFFTSFLNNKKYILKMFLNCKIILNSFILV
mgnify:CR=1 FL=1